MVSPIKAAKPTPTKPTIVDIFNLVENMCNVLAELTERLLPGCAEKIQGATPKEQAKILEELFDTAESTPPKDKALTTILGSMAIGLAV